MLNRHIHIKTIVHQTDEGLLRFRPLGWLNAKKSSVDKLLKKQQLVVIHAIRQIEMHALKTVGLQTQLLSKFYIPPLKKFLLLIFSKKRSLLFGPLTIC